MKKIFTVLALLVSVYCRGQIKISTSFTFNKTDETHQATQGDSIYLKFYTSYSSTDLDEVVYITMVSQNTLDTVLLWTGKMQNIIDSNFIMHVKLSTSSKTTQDYLVYANNIETKGYITVSINNTTAVISPELASKELPVDVFTTTGQYIKSATTKNYTESLNPGVYLFKTTSPKELYSGKFMVL